MTFWAKQDFFNGFKFEIYPEFLLNIAGGIMPSPVGHTLLGLMVYVVWCKNLRRWMEQWKIILWVIFCANLPDFDFFAGLLNDDLSKYHQTYTHTLGFALVVGLITLLVLRLKKVKNYRSIAFLTFLVIFTHGLFDAFNYDTRPPIGVQLLWPFSRHYFNILPIFYAVPHSFLRDIFSSFFMQAIVREVLLLTVPFLLLIYLKIKISHGES